MEVPNKYRGKIIYSDEIVSGDLLNAGKYTGFAEIRAGKEIFSFVDPFSLQKLAGYDKDGNEVWRKIK